MRMSSITNILCIYSQNVHKNYVLVNSLLETQKDLYDILFVQELPQNFIGFALFTTILGRDEVIGTPIHLYWAQVVQFPQNSEYISIIICSIHSRLFRLCFSLRKNTVDHRDIQLLFFFNQNRYQLLMNVYSDSLHTNMKLLFNKALNISNLLYI